MFSVRGFRGDYNEENKELVRMAGKILKSKYNFCDFVDEAFEYPMRGRHEKIPKEKYPAGKFRDIILDVGHNP